MVVVPIPTHGIMQQPKSTGDAARQLGVTEPRLNGLIRRGRVRPEPPIVAGRRLWAPEHVLQVAESLGLLTDELRERLSQEVEHAP